MMQSLDAGLSIVYAYRAESDRSFEPAGLFRAQFGRQGTVRRVFLLKITESPSSDFQQRRRGAYSEH